MFVMPPSYAVLEQRLRGRSKDSEAAMQRRLQTARDEVAAFAEYDYVVVNDELDACLDSHAGDRRWPSARRLRSARGRDAETIVGPAAAVGLTPDGSVMRRQEVRRPSGASRWHA